MNISQEAKREAWSLIAEGSPDTLVVIDEQENMLAAGAIVLLESDPFFLINPERVELDPHFQD